MKSFYRNPAAHRAASALLLCFLLAASHLTAQDYFWVGGPGKWSEFSTHWAKIPTPAVAADFHANVPTSGNDVYFTSNASPFTAYVAGTAYTLDVDASSTVPKCRNMNWTGVPAGTVWGGGGGRMDIYGSLTMDPSLSMTFNNEIHFISNDAATKQIWSKTVHFSGQVFFEGTDGGWQLMDDIHCDDFVVHSGGLWETMGHKVTIASTFYGNYSAGTGQLHLGSSEFIMSGGHAYFRYSAAQFDAGTSHIKMYGQVYLEGPQFFTSPIRFYDVSFFANIPSGQGGFAWGHIDGTLTFHQDGAIHSYGNIVPDLKNVVFLGNGTIYNANNYHNLTLTAGKTYTISGFYPTWGTDQTILPGGSLTALGAGNCSGFITIKSWQYGTPVNFVNNSGSTQTVHCAILEDCHATGTHPLEVLDGVDLGNNTGWVFTNPHGAMDLYWIGGDGDWNDPAHWSEIDGGAAGTCIPNGATSVHFTALSGFSLGDQVTVPEDAYCANMDWTGVTGKPVFYHLISAAVNLHIYGSLTLATDMDFNFGGTVRFRTSNTATITSSSQDFDYIVIFEGTGTWELQDEFKAPYYTVYHERGTFKTLGHPMLIHYWFGNLKEDGSGTHVNMGAELWLGEAGGNSSTVWLVKSIQTNTKGHFRCWYEAGKFHAVESHIIGLSGGYIDCYPTIFHDFWNVTFNPIDHAGDFLYGNILNKLTFLAFGNLIGPNSHIHEVEFHKGAYLFDSHTYDILTIHGGHNFKFQPYTGTGSTVQTITVGGVFNHINTSCEYPTVMHNPTPGETTTFRKEGAGTAFNIQHAIFDRVYADQTSGAIYTATNCVAIQPDVETSWNMTNPTPRDLYWVGGAGDWHSAAHWSLASGGAGGECPPTAHDDVFFNSGSGLGAGDAVTVSQKFAFCKDMDWTGVGSGAVLDNPITTPDVYIDVYTRNAFHVFGDIKMSSAMTNNFKGVLFLRANQPATITSAGNHFFYLYLEEPNGEWSLTDDLWVDAYFTHYYGTFRSANHNIKLGGVWRAAPTATSTFLGSSIVNMLGTHYDSYVLGYAFFYPTYTPGTFDAGTSHFIFENTTQNAIYGNGYNFGLYDVTFKSNNCTLWGTRIANKFISEGDLYIDLAEGFEYIHDAEFRGNTHLRDVRSYHSIKFSPGKRYTFTAGTTQTIIPHNGIEGQFIAQGLPGQYIEMKSSDPSVPATIHMDDYNGTSTCTKYLFLTGMTHTGTEDIYVPTPGGNVFNNSGWQFFPCNPCPASIPVLAANSITVGCAPGKAKLILDGLKPDEWAIWYTDPAATTNIVYNGGTTGPAGNLFEPLITGPVTYYARVYSDGGLCESTVVLAVDITNNTPPMGIFNVTGGGNVCTGSVGVAVGLDDSDLGITYELYLDGVSTGATLPGTGNSLSFGLQTVAGAYTIVATPTGTSCPVLMNGSAVVTGSLNQAPAVVAGSNAPVCAGSTLELYETGNSATSWVWTGPGGFASTDQNPVIFPATTAHSGVYTVVGTSANGCSNQASVTVLVHPEPTMIDIPTDLLICSGSTVTQYYETDDPFTYYLGTVNGGNAGVNTFDGIANYYNPDLVPEVRNLTVTPAHNYNGLVCTGITHPFTITVMPYPEPYDPGDMVFCANESVPLIPHTGRLPTAYYSWTNDNPAIGLAASGAGDIPTFTALNGGSAPVTANIRIRGHYDYGGITCMDTAVTRFRITVTPLPTVTCPPTQVVGITAPAFQLAGATPSGGIYSGPNVTNGTFDPLAAGLGSHPVAYDYTDGNGCPGSCAFSIVVQNVVPPDITCPADVVKTTDLDQCSAVVTYPLPVATDPGGSPVLTLLSGWPSGSVFPLGTTVIVWQATGISGLTATCSFSVTINDGQNPSIVCPLNIVRNTDPNFCSAVVTYTSPTFSDNCPGAYLTLTSGLPSGSAFPIGVNMVNWKATDAAGRMAICGFTVTVSDKQAPTIICPKSFAANTTAGRCDAAVTYATPTFSDNCPGATLVHTGGPASGAIFLKGATLVTYEARDLATPANVSTCSFTVTVNDAELPKPVCPSNQSKNTDVDKCTAKVNYAGTFTDNCTGGSLSIQSGLASGSDFPKGATTVVLKATDATGLTKTCSFKVTVNDAQAPAINCQPDIAKNTDNSLCSAVATYTTPTFTDNCGGGSVVKISGLASGSAFPKGTNVVVWRATDAAGLTKTCSIKVTITDAQLPAITCPANIVKSNDPNLCGAVATYSAAAATDNCPGVAATLLSGLASGAAFPVGTSQVVWKATDAAGLTQTCAFSVQVNDTQAPMLMCPGNTTVNGGGTPCGYPSVQLTGATVMLENCLHFTLTSNAPANLPAGATVVTWTATDLAGNVSNCAYTVTVGCSTSPSSAQSASAGKSEQEAVSREQLQQGAGSREQLGRATMNPQPILQIAPNPATATATITITGGIGELAVFDPLGRMVWHKSVDAATQQLMLDMSGLEFPQGLYQVRLQTAEGTVTKGMVVIKL